MSVYVSPVCTMAMKQVHILANALVLYNVSQLTCISQVHGYCMLARIWLEGGQVSFHFRKAFLFSCKQSMFHCLYCVRIPHCQGEMIIKNNILCKSCYFHLASIVCRHFLSRYLVFAGALFAVEMSWVSCSSYLYWRKIVQFFLLIFSQRAFG